MVSPATLECRSRGTDSGLSRATRAGGPRQADELAMAPVRAGPARNLPAALSLNAPDRGGGDPKSLNVAVWGAASSPQPLRGRVLHE
jgi:hypothetical protein